MKKSQLFMTIFIALIMITSIIGFVIPYDEPSNQYSEIFNGVEFFPAQSGKWVTLVNNNQYLFDYLPNQIEDIQKISTFTLNTNKLYFIYNASSFNEQQEYLQQKLTYNLNFKGTQVFSACQSELDCPDIPIKDCSENGIFLSYSNENKLYLQDNCIIIEGDEIYQNKAIDKITQTLIGI